MKKSFKDSLKALEADIQFANTLLFAYADGKTTISIHERKASLREFYGVIFPSLLQLHRGITYMDDRQEKEICAAKYKKKDEMKKGKLSEIDLEREEECEICMQLHSKIVLSNCKHSMCMKCYRTWRPRSQSCPFCRHNLKKSRFRCPLDKYQQQ